MTITERSGRSRVGSRAAASGLAAALALMVAGMLVPFATGWDVHVRSFPPLHAEWDPRVGAGTAASVLLALAAVRWAIPLAATLPWRGLLGTTYAVGLGWMIALAFVDGFDGVGEILDYKYEYLPVARETDDVPAMIGEYVDRIPFAAGDRRWVPHVAGHPPGALTVFVALDRIGLGDALSAGFVVAAVAASTAVAVLVTLRTLGAEDAARRAAPFLVFAPAAIWQCVSADGMFAAVAAWGLAALAVAGVRGSAWASAGWAVVAGLLLGWCVMMSYGLVLLGLLALAVLFLARSWRPLVPAALAASVVVLTFAVLGFRYWEALPVIRERYWDGVARNRPEAYWLWGNFSALAFSAGPLVGAGVATLVSGGRQLLADQRSRVATVLGGAAATTVLVADLSLMSKGEVERIWLPFAPWLLVTVALLPERWRRRGLVMQLAVALVVQHLLYTGW